MQSSNDDHVCTIFRPFLSLRRTYELNVRNIKKHNSADAHSDPYSSLIRNMSRDFKVSKKETPAASAPPRNTKASPVGNDGSSKPT